MSRESSTADVPPGRHSDDFLLTVLANEQRREVLHYLQRAEDSVVSLGALVDHLVDSDATSDRERERVHVGLHHSHLPKLAETTVIEYDADSRHVRYRGHSGLESLLEAVQTVSNTTTATQPVTDRDQ